MISVNVQLNRLILSLSGFLSTLLCIPNCPSYSYRWSNPVLDRLTGGICSSNSAQSSQSQQQQQSQPSQSQGQSQQRRLPPPPLGVNNAGLRNESYYMATNDNWSPAQLHLLNGHGNTALLIEDDAEPMSP